ncbi:Hemolysin transporter protein ShlB precursor [compost metagenome]
MPFRSSPTARRILACLSLLLCAFQALADDLASQQLRDQQQSLQQHERQLRLERWQRPAVPAEQDRDASAEPSGNQCWRISGVSLAGNQRLSTHTLVSVMRPLVHPCMGIDATNRLLKAITQRYVQAGYPTSRPYLRQPLQHDAALDIIIREGFVESIELGVGELPLSLAGAFPDVLGQPLFLPDIEQGLDQLNRLRAYDIGVDLLPGQRQGGTRVLVQPRRVASRWHLDSRVDNRGTALTGRHRLNLTVGLDSPLGLNDDLRLSLNRTIADAPGQTRGITVSYSIPYGAWTFAVNASQLSYSAPTPESRLISSGSSRFQGISAERMLWRNQQGVLSASARIDHKQLINRTGEQVVDLQSPTLTTVDAGLNLLWLGNGFWYGSLGVVQGTGWFGADRPSPHGNAPQADFRKYRAYGLRRVDGPARWPWRWQSELSLQYSADVLPAVEHLQLADDSAVRGFRQFLYSGASSAAWRNTFSQPLPRSWLQPLQVRPYFGLDLGWTRLADASPSQRLAGAVAGVELHLADSRLRLDYQRALYASDRSRSHLEAGFWVLELNLSI